MALYIPHSIFHLARLLYVRPEILDPTAYHMYIGLHAKYPLFLPDFNENLILSTDFRITLSIKFHENPSSGNQVVPCGRTDIDRQADGQQSDMTKLIFPFRNFTNAPKNQNFIRPAKLRNFATPQ